ncbi:hypothetical protein D3C76_1012980 [compost metagenome]
MRGPLGGAGNGGDFNMPGKPLVIEAGDGQKACMIMILIHINAAAFNDLLPLFSRWRTAPIAPYPVSADPGPYRAEQQFVLHLPGHP